MSQRPHYFIQYAFHAGIKEILWINPYPGRLPALQDLVPGRHAKEPVSRLELPNLYVESVRPIIPIEPFNQLFQWVNNKSIERSVEIISNFKDENTVLVIGKPSLLGIKLSTSITWRQVILDAMDNYPAFYTGLSSRSMLGIEEQMAKLADLILCSSHPLKTKFSYHEKKIQLCLNACTNSFNTDKKNDKSYSNQPLTFGYVGTVASWFDWEWLVELANLHPKNKIRIVGPLKTLKPRNLPTNIKFEKAISHDNVPRFLNEIDIGLIPFRVNEITRYVDPIKFYEYRSMGLAILATNFGEMAWHYANITGEKKGYSIALPKNSLYFPPSDIHPITWDMRFAEVFKNIII